MCINGVPPLTCPFCEKRVEAITLQRDPTAADVCTVTYYHEDGDQHFVQYRPKSFPHQVLLTPTQ